VPSKTIADFGGRDSVFGEQNHAVGFTAGSAAKAVKRVQHDIKITRWKSCLSFLNML
jgi:hypothetical protein